ncbi:MAG TPA: tyrosine-type recombinase/integrase [Blastocatellia bacterium]|nr:tyrosine-type recombinase/integrase [Blastocatellia bacterium]
MEKVEKPTLRAAQVINLLAAIPNEQERLFALLLAVTGMRMGEALALRWLDFNAATGELTIAHTLYRQRLKRPKTEGSIGVLRLDPRIGALLLAHMQGSAFQNCPLSSSAGRMGGH